MKFAQLYCLLSVVMLASSANAQLPGAGLSPSNVTGNVTAPAPAPVEALPVPEPAVSTEPIPAPVEAPVLEPVPEPVAQEPVPAPAVTTEPTPAPAVSTEPAPADEAEPATPPATGGKRNVTITLPPAVEEVFTDGALSVVFSTWASVVIPALLLAVA